jgi:hypothetical protein
MQDKTNRDGLRPLLDFFAAVFDAHPAISAVMVTGKYVPPTPEDDHLGTEGSITVISFGEGRSITSDFGERRVEGNLGPIAQRVADRIFYEAGRYCCGGIYSGETLTVTPELATLATLPPVKR